MIAAQKPTQNDRYTEQEKHRMLERLARMERIAEDSIVRCIIEEGIDKAS